MNLVRYLSQYTTTQFAYFRNHCTSGVRAACIFSLGSSSWAFASFRRERVHIFAYYPRMSPAHGPARAPQRQREALTSENSHLRLWVVGTYYTIKRLHVRMCKCACMSPLGSSCTCSPRRIVQNAQTIGLLQRVPFSRDPSSYCATTVPVTPTR